MLRTPPGCLSTGAPSAPRVRLSVDAGLEKLDAKVGGGMVRFLSSRKNSTALEKGALERSRRT